MSKLRIPGNRLDERCKALGEELDEAVARVISRGVFTPSVEVEAFEEEFANYVGTKYAIGVASGTVAVTLALMAISNERGDRVVSVANVDISASAPITHAGARPVWVDINPRTYNLDPSKLEASITSDTRAIVAVHMYGNPANMQSILETADRYGIPVVEDASLAHGARYRGKQVGSMGTMSCFSFAPGKIMGGIGQAGAILTNDRGLADRVRVLHNYGFGDSSIDAVQRGIPCATFDYDAEGFNARMDELQAAVLRVSLKHLESWINRRRENASIYMKELAELDPEHILLPHDTPDAIPVYRFYVLRSQQRDSLAQSLADCGIWTGLTYVPSLHIQPVYQHLGYHPGSLPQTELVAKELLALPTVPEISTEEIETVADTIRKHFLRR